MRTRNFVAGAAALAIVGVVIAQDKASSFNGIGQAFAELEAKVAGGLGGGIMEGWGDMMACRGMMGGGGTRGSPNEQWRESPAPL